MSGDDDTTAIAVSGGIGSAAGTALTSVTSFTLGTLALAAGLGAAVGYGSYRLLRRRK